MHLKKLSIILCHYNNAIQNYKMRLNTRIINY